MLDALRSIGYEVDTETVYVGKLRLLAEANYPVQTGASLRIPTFEEVRKYFMRTSVEEGMILGVIKTPMSLQNYGCRTARNHRNL